MLKRTSVRLSKREFGNSGIEVFEMLEYERGIVGRSGLRVILVSPNPLYEVEEGADDRDEP
jgi:hypothetical protein